MSEIIEGKPQLEPGVCFICELSNPVRYWDTYRDFYGVVRERIDGRKYVCEECIEQGAKLFGFLPPKAVEAMHQELEHLYEVNRELAESLKAFQGIRDALDVLEKSTTKPEPVKPRAARKPVAAKA